MQYYPTSIMGGGPTGPSFNYPLGGGGYQYGYANPYQVFNPYALQQQQEAQRQAIEREQEAQAMFVERLYRSTCKENGVEPNQEDIDRIHGRVRPIHNDLTPEQQMQYNSLVRNDHRMMQSNYMIDNFCHNATYSQGKSYGLAMPQNQKQIKEDTSLFEFFETVGPEMLYDAYDAEQRKRAQDLQNAYNSQRYKQFLNQFGHHETGYNGYPVYDPTASTDDMSIGVSGSILEKERERQRRRLEFLRSIESRL